MNQAPAIEVSRLGKRYTLGERDQYRALRDVLASAPRRMVGRMRAAREGTDRPQTWALRDVDFSVDSGEVLGIIGHNGAGKSTLLKILSRITRPTEGRALMRGRVGSLLEVGSGFHPELTGTENILLNGAILGMRRAEIEARFDEIVAFSGLERFLDTPVKRYSTGMYMRLAFAVAAHLEPEILVIDEVLAVGDAEFQQKCIGRMSELSGGHGRTVLFVSHNLDAVKQLCHRAIWLDHGQVRADGPTAEVVNLYLEQHVATAQAGAWVDVRGERHRGTGEIRFERVRVDALDDPEGVPRANGRLTIVVEMVARRRVKIGSLGAQISLAGGQTLVNADPVLEADMAFELDPGTHRLRIDIESLPLNAGTYTIGLRVARGWSGRAWSLFDSIDDAVRLDLEEDPAVGPLRGQAVVPCRATLNRAY
jgi:lipopolysaccharide transport system ATP-binding protein